MEKNEKPRLPHGWVEKVSKSRPGRVYFYNKFTKCSAWTLDEIMRFIEPQQTKRREKTKSRNSLSSDKTSEVSREESERNENLKICGFWPNGNDTESQSSGSTTNNIMESNARNRFHPYGDSSKRNLSSTDRRKTGRKNDPLMVRLEQMSNPTLKDEENDDLQPSAMEIDEEPEDFQNQIEDLRVEFKDQTVLSNNLNGLCKIHPENSSTSTDLKKLYIVVDTNIFLSSLSLLEKLTNVYCGDANKTVLIVPWIVFQELDKLKSGWKNPQVSSHANIAIKFLHKHLSHSTSKIEGQTAIEDAGFRTKSNDDKVLQCCMQYAKRRNGITLLLSNDQNLCSKAIVNNIKAFTKETIMRGVNYALNKLGLSSVSKSPTEKNSEIYESARQCLGKTFKQVLEEEFRLAYDKMWSEIVYIKPPWNIVQALKCWKKHWTAVFSLILPSRFKPIIDELIQFFQRDRDEKENLKDLIRIIEISLNLLKQLQKRPKTDDDVDVFPSYIEKLERRVKFLNELHERCETSLRQSSSVRASSNRFNNDNNNNNINKNVPKFQHETQMNATSSEKAQFQPFRQLFDHIWEKIKIICTELSVAFRVPYEIDHVPQKCISKEKAMDTLRDTFQSVSVLYEAMDRIVASSSKQEASLQLYNALIEIVDADTLEEIPGATPKLLHLFCVNYHDYLKLKFHELIEFRSQLNLCTVKLVQ